MQVNNVPSHSTVQTIHPPGPTARWWGLPLLHAMRRDYLGFCTQLQRSYGDISYMRLGNEHAWDLFSPELVREALITHADELIRWERGIEVFAEVLGQNVLVTEGATWQRQRRMLMAAFTPKRMEGYAALMTSATHEALEALQPTAQQGIPIDIGNFWSGVSMDVILRTLFGPSAREESRAAIEATQTLSAIAFQEMFWPMTLPDWLPLPGKAVKRHAIGVLHNIIHQHIAAHRASALAHNPDAPAPDLLTHLMALRDEETGHKLPDSEIFDQCLVSFQAGHETTATALTWWSYLIATHPQAAQRAQEEVLQVVGTGTPGPQHVAALPWLTATLKEAMRLYPPIAAVMTRRTTAPITLGAWHIPKGAMLRITPWVLHRNPQHFAEPDAFKPERFLDNATDIARGAYIPFGLGQRVCLGQHFAMLEMTLLTAMLLQRFTLHAPAGHLPVQPKLNVTLRPQSAITLQLRPHTYVNLHNF
jgi:cytochrome P450